MFPLVTLIFLYLIFHILVLCWDSIMRIANLCFKVINLNLNLLIVSSEWRVLEIMQV